MENGGGGGVRYYMGVWDEFGVTKEVASCITRALKKNIIIGDNLQLK